MRQIPIVASALPSAGQCGKQVPDIVLQGKRDVKPYDNKRSDATKLQRNIEIKGNLL